MDGRCMVLGTAAGTVAHGATVLRGIQGVCVSLADWDQCTLAIAFLAGMRAKAQAEEKYSLMRGRERR